MVNSINSNIAAYYAQGNIASASNSVSSSVARLSSGNRIIKASDDVAGLSIGTSLQTNVATLKVAKLNTSQGSSLLQVADGALSQVSSILQRQKEISVQAGAGSLSDTQRAYLNQEFQGLSSEIDRLAGGANFNGVKLLDGSLSGAVSATTSAQSRDLPLLNTPTTVDAITGVAVAGDTVTVNGVTLTAVASGATSTQFNVGGGAAAQATNIASALNGSTDARLTDFYFTTDASNNIQVQTRSGHTLANRTQATVTFASVFATNANSTPANSGSTALYTTDSGTVLTVGAGNAADLDQVTINGVSVTFTTGTPGTAATAGKVKVGASVTETAANLASFLNSSTDARLSEFNFTNVAGVLKANLATGAVGGSGITATGVVVTGSNLTGAAASINDAVSLDGLGENRTRALGTVSGSLLANNGTGATAGGPIDLSGIRNNAAFVGQLGQGSIGSFSATYTAQDTATFQVKVGDITYSSTATNIATAGATTITLNGSDANGNRAGGSFTLSIAGGAVSSGSINTQADANSLATRLNGSFNNVTFVQNRDVNSFNPGAIVSVGGVQVARMENMSVDLRSDDFSKFDIQSFDIAAPATGSTDAVFSATINGESYKSLSGIGNTFDNNKVIQLQSTTNPAHVLSIVTSNLDTATSSTVSLDVSNSTNAAAVASAFRSAFGLDNAGAGLTFQVGTASSDSLGVKIAGASTSKLYGGAALDVLTQAGAQAASDTLDKALGTISSIRANVGALQSRFNYAAANIDSSIQNQDAARGELLDTDIAAESTSFATSQVKLQAGISTLAQANQQLQSLLKLIG